MAEDKKRVKRGDPEIKGFVTEMRQAKKDDSDDDEEHEAYVSSISRKSILEVRKAGASRILRSGTNRRFPPTELIHVSCKEDGTYKFFEINQRVALILNNFQVPTQGQATHLFEYTDTCDMEHLRGCISYTATIKWQRTKVYRPSRIGKNTFWETGYIGEKGGVPYYSTQGNARRAVSLRILVDFFTFQVENADRPLPPNHYWPMVLLDQTTNGDNFVVLAESKGRSKQEDHLFCIVIRRGDSCVLLIPREHDQQPWKEI